MENHESASFNAFVRSRMLTVPIVFIVLFCLFVPGVAFTQSASAPDSLTLTANPGEIFRGGDMSAIIARVTSGGVPVNDCPVTFAVDKSNIAYFPINNTNVTGSNGETIILLISDDMSGTVTVTAEAKMPGNTNAITATITLTIVDWGTIGGTVFNQSSVPVPGARVTLNYESGNAYLDPQNPQITNVHIAPIGSFAFYRIPVGKYVLCWDTADKSGSLPVTVSAGTSTVIFNENRSFLFPGYIDAPDGQTTLYGYVLDRYKNGVPSATVELYNTLYNRSGDCWDTLTSVAQTRTNNSFNYSGLYDFSNAPYGTYKVVASMSDQSGNNRTYYSIVTLNSSGQVAYIVIPDLAPSSLPLSTPTPSATPSQTAGNATATQTDSGMTVPLVIGIILGVGLLFSVLRRTSRR
jgi:hypothetical protein